MSTYKFSFDNNNKSTNTLKNLAEAEALAVKYMDHYEHVKKCEITTPNGSISVVRKTGDYHWNHNGYSFELVGAENVQAYRNIQANK